MYCVKYIFQFKENGNQNKNIAIMQSHLYEAVLVPTALTSYL